MARKTYVADVLAAAANPPPDISNVVRGGEDGELDFCYTPSTSQPINIHTLASDVSGYPSENTFFIYTESEHVPKGVNLVLERLQGSSAGMRIPELLSVTVSELQKVLGEGSGNNLLQEDDSDDKMDIDTGDEGSEFEWPLSPIHDDRNAMSGNAAFISIRPEVAAALNKRIKEDLYAVRRAGFRVGILEGMTAEAQDCLLSISIRVSQLGLSDEAIQAWDLQKNQYIVLLMQYSAGFKTFQTILSQPVRSHEIAFRIGVSNRYKPTVVEAKAAFSTLSRPESSSKADEPSLIDERDLNNGTPQAGFQSFFISSSLNKFINDQFTSLVKIRRAQGLDWDGAKCYYSANQGRAGVDLPFQSAPNSYYGPRSSQAPLPTVVTADHMIEAQSDHLSFPLIAMQFAMRYLTRCTEFCLVCHDRTEGVFEALKPYVCSKPLCLYQYMSLGFGPSIEHEILTQPHVVDLLISFCYAAAKSLRIREYPIGMSLSVPILRCVTNPVDPLYQYMPYSAPEPSPTCPSQVTTVEGSKDSLKGKYDSVRQEFVVEEGSSFHVRRGDWVVLSVIGKQPTHHRVADALLPTIKLANAAVTRPPVTLNDPDYLGTLSTASNLGNLPAFGERAKGPVTTPAATPPPSTILSAELLAYDQNFDDLDDRKKADTIVTLLETVPSVREMRAYLKGLERHSEPSLRSWVDAISPAALGLLRWIVASNRSCIVQVDKFGGQDADVLNSIRLDHRVSNMDGWVQFRFAQGAPDKEYRFNKALQDTEGRHNKTFPTLFAWHGSGLANWHSIIRSGLDFNDTINGRAFGHGVYHSLEYSVSYGYTSRGLAVPWPGSELKAASAMCLNEIVNAPQEYTSHKPHLVVQHVDWIQCRYLFVKGSESCLSGVVTKAPEYKRSNAEIEQDSNFTAKGVNGVPIGIPRSALPRSREFRFKTSRVPRFLSSDRRRDNPPDPEEILSEPDDPEDRRFFYSDDGAPTKKDKGKGKGRKVDEGLVLDSGPRKRSKSLNDFVPGSLDQSTLQLFEPPAYATTMATQALSRELRAIMKIQDTTPLNELGWYINKELVKNVYQWIVELHSFDAELPLSKDMKKASIKSVVLEMRFGRDYPMSPPFVRVIRPRFLPFMAGGGGHVTAGGALCMELLTNSGWTAVSSIEGVLLQVRMAISNLEPKPARLESTSKQPQRDYGVSEAMQAYIRACNAHGWEVPKSFNQLGDSGGSDSFIY